MICTEGKGGLKHKFTVLKQNAAVEANKNKNKNVNKITLEGRRGIEPKTGLNPFLKTALNFFCMHKTDFLFFLEFFFLYLI